MSTTKPYIAIDSDIPFIKGVLEPWFSVEYLNHRDFIRNNIENAIAIIVRTRTLCNRDLLEGTKIEAIFTATIGNDHIDTQYCGEKGISVYNAAGCNAWGVVQYVMTSLFLVALRNGINLFNERIGIVGAGNVGERLAGMATKMGIDVLRCDPPLENKTGDSIKYRSLEEVIKRCKIITLHVPLNTQTFKMCSDHFFENLIPGTILINSSRGDVIDEAAAIRHINRLGALIVDVWSNEPEINFDYLNITDIATPHIAGYSLEGKINATVYTVKNLAKHFSIFNLQNFQIQIENEDGEYYNREELCNEVSKLECVARILENRFPVSIEDRKLRDNPADFENIRVKYKYRKEIDDILLNDIIKVIKNG